MLLVIIPFGVLAVAENSLNIPLLDGAYIEDVIGDPQYEFIHNWDTYYSDYASIDIRLKNDPGISATHYDGGTPAPAYISLAGTFFYLDDSDDGYGIKMDILPGSIEINPPIEFRAGDIDDVTHTQWRDFTYDLNAVALPLTQTSPFPDCNIDAINDEAQCLIPFSSHYTDEYKISEINYINAAGYSMINLDLSNNLLDENVVISGAGTLRVTDEFVSFTASSLSAPQISVSYEITNNNGVTITDIFLINTGAAAPLTLTDGLTHYYDFDSDVLDKVSGYDFSNTGAVISTGKVSNGILFDGVNDYMQMAAANFLNDAYSISYWVKPNNFDEGGDVAIFGNYPTMLMLYDEPEGIKLITENDGGGQVILSSTTFINDDWNHVVMTIEDDAQALYINDVIVASATTNFPDLQPPDGNYYLGARPTLVQFLDGIVDEMAIYDRAITGSEVSELNNGGVGYNPLTIVETGTVSGIIYSVDQNTQYDVLQGETIILTNLAGDTILQTVTTTISGLYTFDLPYGTYDLYHDQVAPVNIIEDNIVIAGVVAASDYFIDILTPEQISSQGSFSLTNGNTFNLPMTTIFDYASEMEVTFTVAGVNTTIGEGVIQCFGFGCLEIDTNVLYVTTAGTGIISNITLTGINYYGATDLNEYKTVSEPPFNITVTDALLDPPVLVVPIPDFTVSLAEVKTFLVSDYFTNWDNITLGFQDDIAEQTVLLTSGKGLATDTYNVNHVTVTLTPLVDDVRITLTAKLVSGFSTNFDLKVFNADGLDNDVFSYTIVNLVNEKPIVKEQIYDFNSVVEDSYLFPMNDYFYNSDTMKATFTIGSTVYTLNEGESIETDIADFTIVFNTFVFNPKAIGVVTNIILTGINNNGETSMLPFETTINYPIQIPGIKKQIESSVINFNIERTYSIDNYFEFYDNFYASFYYNNTVYNLMGDTVEDLGFATITIDQTDKTLVIDSKEVAGKLNDIIITAINVHGTNTLNPFTVEVQTGGELLSTILGSGVLFPDSTTLTSTQKWTYASLTILGVLLLIMILGFFIIRSVDISPVLVIVTAIIGAGATFFYFIAIKYIPVGVLIVVVLISGAIIFVKAR